MGWATVREEECVYLSTFFDAVTIGDTGSGATRIGPTCTTFLGGGMLIAPMGLTELMWETGNTDAESRKSRRGLRSRNDFRSLRDSPVSIVVHSNASLDRLRCLLNHCPCAQTARSNPNGQFPCHARPAGSAIGAQYRSNVKMRSLLFGPLLTSHLSRV
jgi:hypothetical protein